MLVVEASWNNQVCLKTSLSKTISGNSIKSKIFVNPCKLAWGEQHVVDLCRLSYFEEHSISISSVLLSRLIHECIKYLFCSLQRETKTETAQLSTRRYARFAIEQPGPDAPRPFKARIRPSGAENPPGMCALDGQSVSGSWLSLLATADSKTGAQEFLLLVRCAD